MAGDALSLAGPSLEGGVTSIGCHLVAVPGELRCALEQTPSGLQGATWTRSCGAGKGGWEGAAVMQGSKAGWHRWAACSWGTQGLCFPTCQTREEAMPLP